MEKFKELSKLAHHSKLLWQTDQPELLSDQKILAHILQKKVGNDLALETIKKMLGDVLHYLKYFKTSERNQRGCTKSSPHQKINF